MNEQPNMDKRLRQLENQSIPDMSRQDEHWQGMKQLLQTGALPAAKPVAGKTFWYWVAAAASVSAVVIYLVVRPGEKKKAEPVTATVKEQVIPQEPASYSNDTVSMITAVSDNETTVLQKKPRAKNTGSGFTLKAKTPDGAASVPDARLADEPTVATKTTLQDPKASLAAFFAQLEKPVQEFVIDNRKDTLIWGNEGSALLISANAFNTKEKVKITVREFYSYQDIITHKLSTTSDGDQLETGGMLHISASINGREVNVAPYKSIRWFLPDTSARIADMQLFTGMTGNSGILYRRSPEADTLDYAANSPINWKASNNGFDRNYVSLWVKVVDLRDLPFRTSSNKNYKGYFYINRYSDYSKSQLRNMLQKKYPHYDKIIIAGKRKKKEVSSPLIELRQVDWSIPQYSIGDTTWLQPTDIKAYNLEILDTLTYTWNSSAGTISPTLNSQLKKVAGKYSVDISSLGWISCDKFYRSKEPKVQYVVNLDDKAANYHSFIVFDRIKSIMTGYESGNRVVFPNIPVGEKVKVISVGIKDGKTVAAMTATETSAAPLSGLRFEQTSPAAFREQAGTLDNKNE